ncbi:NADH-quinone oxidoreductase subunit D [Zhaonella formicivorans]|uniref:NADH-quinone oxidoreductase subunit D n=1 Tax=Zhaonella formicivorans TaxID=2528593 RepID=UPI001D0FABE1|nr:NADH-quinone oxidoreductase subunit D [Zhaonella formicivorans]
MSLQEKNLHTEELTINMGPQHPSTHGVYRAVLTLDGEHVVNVENVIGYLHRGMEKIAESRTYTQFIPYTDRMDYMSGMLNELGYVQAVETLMGVEVPERAEYLRIIMAELQRIASHMVYLGSMALDLNGFTPWMYFFRDREKILDLFEMTCGSRLTTSYMRVGGVSEDIPEEFLPQLQQFLADMPRSMEEYDQIVTGNEIFQARTKDVGIISGERALAYGLTGPNLRASGIDFDLRRDAPYGIYDRFDFKVVVGTKGDCFERWMMRIGEVEESLKIIAQAARDLPDGPVMAKVPKVLRPPVGEIYHQIEGSKGILGYYLVSDGSNKPYRLHIHGPSFVNIGAYPEMARGGTMQDAVAILASLDPVLGEVDR